MASTRSPLRLAHGWILVRGPSLSATLVREFIHPPVRAVPCSMARRLGSCRISLPAEVASGVASRWTISNGGLEVTVTTAGIEEHDVAMELLLCLGQGLWERLSDRELRAYWMLLNDEISAGIEGEIDEQVLEEKRSLFESRSYANNAKRLTGYGRASFKLMLPNVEMRLDIKTTKSKGINLHLLFSPEDPNHEQEIERLLSLLEFEFDERPYRCAISDLTNLGYAVEPGLTTDSAALYAGTNQFKTTLADLKKLFRKDI